MQSPKRVSWFVDQCVGACLEVCPVLGLSFAYWFVGQAVGACLHLLLMVFIMYAVLYYYLTLFSYTPCIHKGNPRKGVPYICPSVCVFILHVS